MASISEAIKQAKDIAANEAVVNQEDTGGDLVEGYVSGGVAHTHSAPSFSTFSAQKGLIPRNALYLKPTKYGLHIGKNKDLIQDFEAEVTLVEGEGIQPKWTIRWGNPAKYASSYDGITCNKGGSWNDAVLMARRADANSEPYPAAEVKLTLLHDLKLKQETIPAGTIIGYDTSAPSRYNDLSDFFDEAQRTGKMGQTVKVKVVAKEIEYNGNNWGTTLFELLD